MTDLKITVATSILIDYLKKNKKKYMISYQEALKKWKDESIEKLTKMLDAVSNNTKIEQYSIDSKPSNIEAEYDSAITMLALHAEDTITISTEDYKKFVEDKWNWKTQWNSINSKYLEY